VFTLEKEAIPLWNKFLQGYYDVSGITAEAFERTITLSSKGDPSLSDDMRAQGITMQTDVGASLYWFGFNMLDDVVGGYTPERRKLRQAVSIALDYNEFLDIFLNGRGLAAQGLIPPGLFGHTTGAAGINPYVDQWDPVRNKAVRRPIEDARRLLAEAGYPQGRSPDGRPLVLSLDHSGGGDPAFMTQIEWMRKRLKLIGVDLQDRGTELKRFREKMDAGNFQLCRLGWMADYPDAENFTFLLYGPNAKYKTGGENKTNYENPEYDSLFEKMESMENGPERQAIIDPLMDIARRDAPMCWGYHPVLYGLSHAWHHNGKPHQMTRNTLKYIRVDPALRVAQQRQWNRPRVLPILLAEAALMLLAVPAIYRRRRAEREGGAC
jgi:ABC-type transport system substrate-binding protein